MSQIVRSHPSDGRSPHGPLEPSAGVVVQEATIGDALTNSYAGLVTNPAFSAPHAWASVVSSEFTRNVNISTIDPTTFTQEVIRQVRHELATAGAECGFYPWRPKSRPRCRVGSKGWAVPHRGTARYGPPVRGNLTAG